MAGRANAKLPAMAPAVDLGALDIEGRRARLTYLFQSGARIGDEEREFWWGPFDRKDDGTPDYETGGWLRREPFNMERCGLFIIKTKDKGLGRFYPNEEQAEVIEHRELCWRERWYADIWVLKCRRDGMSTEATMANLSSALAIGECSCHIVGHEVKNTRKMLGIVRLALRGLPYWMVPDKKCMTDSVADGRFQIDDEAAGILHVVIETDTARAGETISRGGEAQFRHYGEVEWWWAAEEAFGALFAAHITNWPASQTAETTGKRTGSAFYNKFLEAKRPNENSPGTKAFFFAWFHHKEYRLALPRGVSETEFWERMLPEDKAVFDAYGCDAEQANWYDRKKKDALDMRVPLNLFRREFPFNEQEAFLGGGNRVFDAEALRRADAYAKLFKRGTLSQVEKTAFPKDRPENWAPKFAKVSISPDADLKDPVSMVDNPHFGHAYVWERPRPGHDYCISVDLAENKREKGSIDGGDWLRIKVTRETYDPRCDQPVLAPIVMVSSKSMGPFEAARVAVALANIYPSRNGRLTEINFEQNGQGLAFEGEVKRVGGIGYLYKQFREDGINSAFVGFGVQMTGGQRGVGSKNKHVEWLKGVVDGEVYVPLDPDEIAELGVFDCNEGGIYAAPTGEHDDCVSTARLMCVSVQAKRKSVVVPFAVVADGDVNLIDPVPERNEVEEAWLETTFKNAMPKGLALADARKRREGYRGGV